MLYMSEDHIMGGGADWNEHCLYHLEHNNKGKKAHRYTIYAKSYTLKNIHKTDKHTPFLELRYNFI